MQPMAGSFTCSLLPLKPVVEERLREDGCESADHPELTERNSVVYSCSPLEAKGGLCSRLHGNMKSRLLYIYLYQVRGNTANQNPGKLRYIDRSSIETFPYCTVFIV